MRLFAFIQARLNSSRLPAKVLSSLPWSPDQSKNLLEHIHSRLSQVIPKERIVFLIPDDPQEYQLAQFLESKAWNSFQGSPDDVRDRYYQAALFYQADAILRLTGDNPFIDIPAIESILEAWNYSAEKSIPMDLCYASPLPLGMGIESFSYSALESGILEPKFQEEHHKEHVSLHIKENPRRFRIVKIPTGLDPAQVGRIRMTIDEKIDFETLRSISEIFLKGTDFSGSHEMFLDEMNAKEIIQLSQSRKELFSKNLTVEQVKFPLPPHPPQQDSVIHIYTGDPSPDSGFGTGHWERCRILSSQLTVEGYGVTLNPWIPKSNDILDSKVEGKNPINENPPDLVIFDARDYEIKTSSKVLYLDNNSSTIETRLDILPNIRNEEWFTTKSILVSSRLFDDKICQTDRSIPSIQNIQSVRNNRSPNIVVYTGNIIGAYSEKISIYLKEHFADIRIIHVGKYSFHADIHHTRISKLDWYDLLRNADFVLTYFGQTLLEAIYLKKPVASFSISPTHEELSELMEEKMGIPFWGNPMNELDWKARKKEFTISREEIHGNGTERILEKIKGIL